MSIYNLPESPTHTVEQFPIWNVERVHAGPFQEWEVADYDQPEVVMLGADVFLTFREADGDDGPRGLVWIRWDDVTALELEYDGTADE